MSFSFRAKSVRTRFLKTALLCNAAAFLPLAAPAQAVEAAAADGDTIIVTGTHPIAESEAKAIAMQRAAPAIVSVIAADSLGRLPDQNIAQALSRLPGISTENDQGQGRYINIRGAPKRWSTLSFDGINVVSAEGRTTRYDSVPTALASAVVVQKAVTPDMPGETIAGNVDVITRSAFDYRGFHVQARGSYSIAELGSKNQYDGSLIVSDRWQVGGGEIGVVLGGSYFQRDLITENFETDWATVSRDQRPGFEDRVWAKETRNKMYDSTRTNWSASGRLEWKPDVNNRVYASSIYTIFKDDELRRSMQFRFSDQEKIVPNASAACPSASAAPATGTTGYADICTGNTPYQGTVYGTLVNPTTRNVAYRQSIWTNTLGGDHSSDKWTVKWRANYTRAIDNGDRPSALSYQSPAYGANGANAATRPTIDYDFTDPLLAKVSLYSTIRDANGNLSKGAPVASLDAFDAPLIRIQARKFDGRTHAYTGRFDVTRETGLFGDTKIGFGARYDDRTKEVIEHSLDMKEAQIIAAGIPRGYSSITRPGTWPGGDLPLGYTFDYYDGDKANGIVNQAVAAGATFNFASGSYYKTQEKAYAGYLMATTTFDWGNIVYGARVEHVKIASAAYRPGSATDQYMVGSDYTAVLPSAHINYDLASDMKLRLSANTGAGRADYALYRPNFTIDDTVSRISGGNPDLKPEKTWGVDLYWEWYLRPRGFVSLGIFYKKARDILFDGTTVFGRDTLNSNGVDRSSYLLNTTVNGGSGRLYGFEANAQVQLGAVTGQDRFIDGFGIQANATYNDGEAKDFGGNTVPFPGTSKWIVNVGPYYEGDGASVRLSYQFRSPWLDSLGDETTGGDFFWAKRDSLDFSARYALTQNAEIFVDATNLLNSPGRRYAGDPSRTVEFEKFGRRYTAGARITF